jgi:Mrp family chromosome partitioning ATPase
VATPPEQRPVDDEREGMTLRDYLGVMWRRKWVIILVTVVATAAAFGFSYRQAKVYEAQADLIYEQQFDVANPLTGQSYTDPTQRSAELTSVNAIIQSPTISHRVTTALEEKGLPTSGYEVRAEVAQDQASATGTQSSSVVSVIATSGEADYSAAVANTYAEEFVDWRKENMTARITGAIDAVSKKVRAFKGSKESSDYLILAQRLQDLQILRDTITGNFRVLVPATAPTAPISPKPLRSAILGFGVGLFAGIGLAFLLEQFDTRVRRADDVAALLRQPVLARIPRLSREQMKSPHLVTMEHPADAVAEAFRLLRTNLAFMDVDGNARSMLVTSSLQGEGKSVTVANLAVTLALAGKKVIIVDADLRRPRQHRLFGLQNEVGASNVAVGDADLVTTLQSVQVVSPAGNGTQADFTSWTSATGAVTRLWVLTSGPIPPNPGEIVASQRFSQMLGRLRDECDVRLVDSPAMLAVGDTAALASEVDGLLFLVDMEKARRPVIQAAADQLYRLPCAMMGIIVRSAAGSSRDKYYYTSHYRYSADAPQGAAATGRSAAPGAGQPS